MRYFHKTTQKYHCPTINLDKIWTLVPESIRKENASKSDVAPVVDLTQSGVFKVLGKGILPSQPIIVKAKFFSKSAEKKIKAAGGACVLTA
jgi:large subunit ribosomal protein L27Ae